MDASHSVDVTSTATAILETLHPNAFMAIFGDVDHVNLTTPLPTFNQFVESKIRENKTTGSAVC